jgi:threonine/homoserine/homoserine lactone efflux protein
MPLIRTEGQVMTEQIGAFLIVSLTIIIVPGPDLILILRNAIRGGKTHAVYTAAGVMVGNAILASAAAAGLAALLLGSEILFSAIKICGAFYLIYLGLKSIIRYFTFQSSDLFGGLQRHANGSSTNSWSKSFREGLVSNLLNPKVAAFYLSLFPQFHFTSLSPTLQNVILAATFVLLASMWYVIVIACFSKFERAFKSPRFVRGSEAVAGTILLGLGVFVLTNRSRALALHPG